MRGSAQYIGRVGALAVALGIGTAVAATPWSAVAQPTDSASSSTTSESDSTSTNASTTSPSVESPASEDDESSPADVVDAAEEEAVSPDDTESDENDEAGAESPESTSEGAEHDSEDTEPPVDPASSVPAPPASNGGSDHVAAPVTVAPPDPVTQAASVVTTRADAPDFVAATASADDPIELVPETTFFARQSNTPAIQAVPPPSAPVTTLVSGLLSWVGLAPSLSTNPVAPAQTPALWTMLAWARRQIGPQAQEDAPAALAVPAPTSLTIDSPMVMMMMDPNSPPVLAAPTVNGSDPITGVLTGAVNATDPDGDTLTYTLTEPPAGGTVSVDAATGAFTYTPTPAARLAAGLTPGPDFDQFVITISDGQATVDQPLSVQIVPTEIDEGAPIDVGRLPEGVAASGDRVYVANHFDRTVTVIDATTGTVLTTIAVGGGATGVAVNPAGDRAYVTLKGTNRVAVIDTATNTVIQSIHVGQAPTAIAVSPDGSRVYVTNSNGANVSVINTATGTEVARIKVGSSPAGVTVSADGTRVYVTNRFSDTVSVIDTAIDTVVGTHQVGDSPRAVAVSSDGTRLYVANYGDDSLSVINTVTNQVTYVSVGSAPTGVAVSPDGTTIFVANGDDTLTILNSDNVIVDTVTIDPDPENGAHLVAVSTDGTRVYITDTADRTLRVLELTPINQPPVTGNPAFTVTDVDIDTGVVTGTTNITDPDGNTLTFTLTTAPDPAKGTVVVDPTTGVWTYTPTLGARLDATDVNATLADQQVSFTITATDSLASAAANVTAPVTPLVIDTIAVGDGPAGVAVNPNGTRVYVANYGEFGQDGVVSVIDAATNTVISTIPVGANPVGVAISPDGTRAYVGNSFTGTVSVIDTATNMIIATVPSIHPAVFGTGPRELVVDPLDGNTVYASDFANGDGVLSIIDTATNTVVTSIAVDPSDAPRDIAISPNGQTVYLTTHFTGDVLAFDTDTNTVIVAASLGTGVSGVAVSPTGSHIYVTSTVTSSVTVIETSSYTVVATIGVGPVSPVDVAVSPNGDFVFVANRGGDTVTVIDAATNTVLATIGVGDEPSRVAVSPDGTRVYVSNSVDNTVSVINL